MQQTNIEILNENHMIDADNSNLVQDNHMITWASHDQLRTSLLFCPPWWCGLQHLYNEVFSVNINSNVLYIFNKMFICGPADASKITLGDGHS